MSAARKGFYFKRLKEAGVPLERHFRDYTLDELIQAHKLAEQEGVVAAPTMEELADLDERAHRAKQRKEATEAARSLEPDTGPPPLPTLPDAPVGQQRTAPVQVPLQNHPDPDEMAGVRQNSKDLEDPIRIDDQGRKWLQEEVKKPAYPKPRGRRILRYNDPGVRTETVKQGEYTETFEVSGDPKNATPSEVKITLPSYQVGIYRDPRFPFKVITYNGNSGFDRQDVVDYYGGVELVPDECKRKYVENVLCYDMRSVIRAIQTEFRQHQLAGTIK